MSPYQWDITVSGNSLNLQVIHTPTNRVKEFYKADGCAKAYAAHMETFTEDQFNDIFKGVK